jgi:hypothetical protein
MSLLRKLHRACCRFGSHARADFVTLQMWNPITEGSNSRGMRRIGASGEFLTPFDEPYGYVIPTGRHLVVTDLGYYSGFTNPRPPGELTQVVLSILTPDESGGLTQTPVFVATATFAQNGFIGGNVEMQTGFAVCHGHFLTVTIVDFELVSTEVFVYGYLTDSE